VASEEADGLCHVSAEWRSATKDMLAVEDGRAFVKLLMERTTKYDDHLHREQVQGGLAPQTIHGFVRSLRAFASWLERKGYTQDNIFKAIKPPSSPKF
jgi:site-specific recombinase XerD